MLELVSLVSHFQVLIAYRLPFLHTASNQKQEAETRLKIGGSGTRLGISHHITCVTSFDIASFLGHSQILSCRVNFSPLLQDKLWEWPVNEATSDTYSR